MTNEASPVALITGATSGIGAAVARRFASANMRVLACGRNQAVGAALQEELSPSLCHFHSVDLRDSRSAESCVVAALERFGRIDVLVNAAGVIEHGTVLETDAESWRRQITVNLDTPFYLCRATLPSMIAQASGVVINISSTWGLVGGEKAVAYCASKGGLNLLTQSLALEVAAKGIRVNALCPGAVDTPMLAQEAKSLKITHEEARSGWTGPNGRIASPEDIAEAAFFLASPAARHINGVMLPIDGGGLAG